MGSLAEARKIVYRASAENRRNVNGVPLAEPVAARPSQYAPGVDYPKARDEHIVRAAIHPAIGIARVGNSADEFYVGPLVTHPAPQPVGSYRDAQGALKRQAAQFRLYGYNAAGEVVRELTADWADIRWSVHVANRKAAWYQWQMAMDMLQRWAAGDFSPDWGGSMSQPPTDFASVPLADQPGMLDRAALEFCLADAFHPGCETTWPMRHLTLYDAPFRIRRRPVGTVERDYGRTLNQAEILAADGPLHAQGPGDINRWMGLPWQADTAFCRAGYDTEHDPFVPTFWPARVPNHVLTAADYAVVTDPKAPLARRVAAFADRTDWNQPLHVLDRVLASGHRPCHATLSSWGGPELQAQDFLFQLQGPGWQLDRARFDGDLRRAAAEAGVEVAPGARLEFIERAGYPGPSRDGLGLVLRQPDRLSTIQCRWLVDAGGRAATLSRQLGARRHHADTLIGVHQRLPAARDDDRDGCTLVEAVADGWW